MGRVGPVLVTVSLALLLTVGALGWLLPHHHHDAADTHNVRASCGHTCRGPFAEHFADADRRLAGDGSDKAQGIRFDVPAGTQVLRIGAAYRLDGAATFTLRDPLGRGAPEHVDGRNELSTDDWKTIESPVPGSWTFSVDLRARGDYAFGFYFCGRVGSSCAVMAA